MSAPSLSRVHTFSSLALFSQPSVSASFASSFGFTSDIPGHVLLTGNFSHHSSSKMPSYESLFGISGNFGWNIFGGGITGSGS
jgi:hypothetical protein